MLYLRSWRSDICPPRDSRYTCGLGDAANLLI